MIRSARPADASRLAETLIFAKRVAYRPIFQDDAVSFNQMQVLPLALRLRDDPDALRDVYVYDDGIVKGMMRWGREPGARQLSELYVDPFFQGQGVGRARMDHFLACARADGAPRVYLWVLEDNRAARAFYERAGLSPDGERRLEPGTDKYLLRYAAAL